MPSTLHEGIAELFRAEPALAVDFLAGTFGIAVPRFREALLSSSDLTETVPTEYRADAVVTLNRAGKPVYAVVVEVQLRFDPQKLFTWPVYVGTVRARLRCPVRLLVICPTANTAARYARPIDVGDGSFTLAPVVLGPGQTPLVTDARDARRNPLLAVLSACVHGRKDRPAVFKALLAALDSIEPDRAKMYIQVVLSALPPARRTRLEEFMTTAAEMSESDFARIYLPNTWAKGEAAGEAKGEARGEAKALLKVLDARGVAVPDDVRSDILACTDTDKLELWIQRAATADAIEDVIGI